MHGRAAIGNANTKLFDSEGTRVMAVDMDSQIEDLALDLLGFVAICADFKRGGLNLLIATADARDGIADLFHQTEDD